MLCHWYWQVNLTYTIMYACTFFVCQLPILIDRCTVCQTPYNWTRIFQFSLRAIFFFKCYSPLAPEPKHKKPIFLLPNLYLWRKGLIKLTGDKHPVFLILTKRQNVIKLAIIQLGPQNVRFYVLRVLFHNVLNTWAKNRILSLTNIINEVHCHHSDGF